MVVVEFLYDEMKKITGLTKEQVIDGLMEIGAPCEYDNGTRKVLVELTPNRPDWYSMEGMSRALKSYYGRKHNNYRVKKSDYKVIVDASVAKVRPFSVCAVVKGLEFTDERIVDMVLLQEKLLGTLGRKVKRFGIGIYPLHAIKFPVKYTTLKAEDVRYRPLNYPHEAGAAEILEKHPKGQEYGHLIKDLPRLPVFLDANNKVMALIPIVNSQETGMVDLETTGVFIEVTGTDIYACKAALNIIVCTFADMGGTICSVEMDYGTERFQSPDLEPKRMKLDVEHVNKVLGMEFSKEEITNHLSRMGYEVDGGDVLVPPYRADIIGMVDIVEDVAISYGYNNFKPTLPNFFSAGQADHRYDKAHEVMRGMGFMQTDTFILTNESKLMSIGYEQNTKTIINPSGEEFTAIRPTLLADALDTFATNKTKGLPQKFYEIGIVYNHETQKRLVFGVMDQKLDFSTVKGYLQTLLREMGLQFELKGLDTVIFDKERSAAILVRNKGIGVFGKVDKKILEKFGLEFDVYLCEIYLE
ncbi:MAG: phenylalanine--tRNA ligase subunit beta [Candidatus Micrarchaeota archaeon]